MEVPYVKQNTGGYNMATITLTKENFKQVVLESKGTVLVDFWAAWCGPCKMVGPVLEEFSNEHKDIVVGKVNVDEQEELASEFSIMSIPTLIVFKDGKSVRRESGARDKAGILQLVK